MKILLSEAQIIQLLKESYGNEAYIDALLDKMSGQGLSALTDKEKSDLEKMSRGEDIDFDGDDSPETQNGDMIGTEIPAQDLFMELVPNHYEFNVDGDMWRYSIEMEPDGNFDVLLVSNAGYDKTFMITPFSVENEFKVTTPIKDYKFKVESIPDNHEDMKKFIQVFISKILPGIVKYIKMKE